MPLSDIIEYKDIEKIRLSREILEKWIDEIYFDDVVKGCFVRINLGVNNETKQNMYRLCEIEDVIV